MSSPQTTASTTCAVAGLLLVGSAAAFRWSGQPTVVGAALGIALLVLAVMWRTKGEVSRLLPAATMLVGMALVVAPPVLDYDDGTGNEHVAVAYALHILLGLALASVGFWSGKKLGTPRIDQL